MLIVLDLATHSREHLEGTAVWDGAPSPTPFSGVLELLAVLEGAVQGAAPDVAKTKEGA